MRRSLSREDGSVVYNCCWPSPAQSFSAPTPVGLLTIFYCLRFETSFSIVSYDSVEVFDPASTRNANLYSFTPQHISAVFLFDAYAVHCLLNPPTVSELHLFTTIFLSWLPLYIILYISPSPSCSLNYHTVLVNFS
jgi:hypothetical protein